MESSDFVAFAELLHACSNAFNITGDIIALVDGVVGLPFWQFPVLGVRTRDYDADEDLVGSWFGDFHVADVD